jgi:predicted ATPase
MPQLLHLSWKYPPPPPGAGGPAEFPFSVPAIRTMDELELDAPVTLFVGENGSGKSTLLEGIAAAANLPVVGTAGVWDDPTLAAQRRLASALKLTWRNRSSYGFYLRAEDFFGWLKQKARDDARIEREKREFGRPPRLVPDDEPAHRDEHAAAGYLARYDARSHGESFLDLFRSRIDGTGLYLMDEPEAPLSPQRQLALLALMGDAVRDGAQFIVATHSPILLAFPGARIYSFDEPPIRQVRYDELEHVTLTRDFLSAPERFLRHLGMPGL